jgi:hypothetical protein
MHTHTHRCTFYVRDTAIRGPLLLDATKARRLGFFDEQNIVLGGDDHDFFARAYFQYGWVTGLMRINFEHRVQYGETHTHVAGVAFCVVCLCEGELGGVTCGTSGVQTAGTFTRTEGSH